MYLNDYDVLFLMDTKCTFLIFF